MSLSFQQSYPPPTELPAMRSGEISGRYMDCSTVLNPVSDTFVDITDLAVTIIRTDGLSMGADDLQAAPGWAATLDPTKTIATFVWLAPITNVGTTYVLTLSGPTASGETFVRDWKLSIVPLMG